MSAQMPLPPSTPSSGPAKKPLWKRWWFWVGVVLVIGIGAAVAGGGDTTQQATTTSSGASSGTTTSATGAPNVADIPVFSVQSGGQVVALVNKQGEVSAKLLGDQPITCMVTAGNIVQWDKSSSSYTDTGNVALDAAGEPATSLMGTFFGPVGTGDQQGYVFHADMGLQASYPKAIVVTLVCSY